MSLIKSDVRFPGRMPGMKEPDLRKALTEGLKGRQGPSLILARTTAGKGVSFMEGRLEWHYRNINVELAGQALQEIGGQA